MTEPTPCKDLGAAESEAAFAPALTMSDALPRERVLGLLERMAKLAAPGDGAGPMLEVLGRMASCGWVEGQLAVVIRNVEVGSEVDLLAYDGLSYTRIRPPLFVDAPLEEFVQWVAAHGGSVGALDILFDEPGIELQLAASEPPAESMRLATPSTADDEVASIHHRSTMRLAAVRIPPEARPPPADVPPREPNSDPPVTRPGAYSLKPSNETDEGWDT